MNSKPHATILSRYSSPSPYQIGAFYPWTDAHQNAFRGWPWARDGVFVHVGTHLIIDPFGSSTH